MNIYNSSVIPANYTQQLNSTLVDPSNVPDLDESQAKIGAGLLPDTNPNSTMSGDNVDLSGLGETNLGMDSSTEISNS